MSEIEITVNEPGPAIALLAGVPFVPRPREFDVGFDLLAAPPTYTLMTEDNIFLGPRSQGWYTRLGPLVFFDFRIVTGSVFGAFTIPADVENYMVIDLPIPPAERPGLKGSGYIASKNASRVPKWSTELVLDPTDRYDLARPVLARTGETDFNPVDPDDGDADPPPTYLTGLYRPPSDGSLLIVEGAGFYFAA